MGLRHLDGLAALEGELHVVDPRPEVEDEVRARAPSGAQLLFHRRLEDVPLEDVSAAILAETASGRLERLELVAPVRHLLVEKPLEQSRARVRRAAEVAPHARINHYRRTVELFRALRAQGGPFRMAVTGGAFGLACNGIHELDLACFLAGAPGRVAFAALDATPIASGRGAQFRDYGGRVLVDFDDGSSLYLESVATSSAPPLLSLVQDGRLVFSDGTAGVVHERDPRSAQPAFRYGADYARRETPPPERVDLANVTAAWLRWLGGGPDPGLPTLREALPAHELLFDVLETTGDREFPIT